MKKFKAFCLVFTMIIALSFVFVGCSMNKNDVYNWNGAMGGQPENAEGIYDYNEVIETPFYDTEEQNTSYFSLDRNTAGYSYMRRQIMDRRLIAADSIRLEELVNYFDYGYPAPEGDGVIKASTYLTDCPWNGNHKLLTVGIKTKEVKAESQSNNFVFLIDVSGSMSGDTRLGLVKYGINLLIDELSASDRVSIVTYANGVAVKLESTLLTSAGKKKAKAVVNALKANGGTNGSGGIEKAYQIAESQRAAGVNSRVILMSDGDFNIGLSTQGDLKDFIKDKAKGGVYLSVLGFGMGNTRDSILETLARNGNGNYAYIDCKTEAEKVFKEELDGMLVTVLKDAKAGVTFTDNVKRFRLLGYDTKILSEDEFNNEKTDAGEIGSNLTVTAMYEIELADGVLANSELATVEIKYKNTLKENVSESVETKVFNVENYEARVGFAACVAEFGLILRNSEYKANASITSVLARLEELSSYINQDIYKKEFVQLVGLASEYNYASYGN